MQRCQRLAAFRRKGLDCVEEEEHREGPKLVRELGV